MTLILQDPTRPEKEFYKFETPVQKTKSRKDFNLIYMFLAAIGFVVIASIAVGTSTMRKDLKKN